MVHSPIRTVVSIFFLIALAVFVGQSQAVRELYWVLARMAEAAWGYVG